MTDRLFKIAGVPSRPQHEFKDGTQETCVAADAAPSGTDPVGSLYVHVPFCGHKCEYCAFYSHAPSADQMDRYVRAVVHELEMVAGDLKPRTIFFGGGTPSLLTVRQWEVILSAMHRLGLAGAEEWTVECNPATVSLEKARLLLSAGVNRISMGVQSFHEGMLERLGRIHTRETALRSFDLLRRAGVENINLDLMFAIPGQTMEDWKETLEEAKALGSEHLSCYEVIYEEDTPLFAQLQAGEFSVDPDLACEMYDALLEAMPAGGLYQYEVANFARNSTVPRPGELPERACRHNVNYWRSGSCYGVGPSATSYVRGLRSKNWPNTTLYCEQIEAGRRPVEWTEQLSPQGRAGEAAAFGLRMNAGWEFERFKAVTGFDLRAEWGQEMARAVSNGMAEMDGERFWLTGRGLRYADAMAEEFLRLEAVGEEG